MCMARRESEKVTSELCTIKRQCSVLRWAGRIQIGSWECVGEDRHL